MNTATKEKSVQVNKSFPESIARILLSSNANELKKRIITENGISIADEESILKQKENLDITATLEVEEDIDNHFSKLMK